MKINETERERVRTLAKRWMEIASDPVMDQRKRVWKSIRDLKQERPAILVETSCIDGFITEKELLCENELLRGVERHMLRSIKQFETVGDDIVLEPYYRLGWIVEEPGYGVDVETKPAMTSGGETSLGYSFNFPIKTPEDISRLSPRTTAVNKKSTHERKSILEDIIGSILPVRLGNYDPLCPIVGDDEWTGMFFFALTWQLYRFIGNDHFLFWVYDEPDAVHSIMEYMVKDRLRTFHTLEAEGVLVPNTDNQMAGPRFYGYVSDLPDPESTEPAKLKDLWGWPESQESINLSPSMFKEFVLPYYAKLASEFGYVYYGCCEPVDDRIDLIKEAMPNLRAVSISGWADFDFMAEQLGSEIVYSRKPTPAYMSGKNPDWELMKQDLRKTYEATRKNSCNTELLVRDLYTVNHDLKRLKEWTDTVKSIFRM